MLLGKYVYECELAASEKKMRGGDAQPESRMRAPYVQQEPAG